MKTLEELAASALQRDAVQPAIEFQGRWIGWGEMRQVADRLSDLIETSGAGPSAPVAFMPRNRPSAVAALLALIAKGRTVRMIYAFQSPAGVARDIERLKPAVLIAAAEDYSTQVISALWEHGVAGIAINEEMDAFAISGRETSLLADDPDVPTRPQIEILTSGTTGPPKPFALGYDFIAEHIVDAYALRFPQEREPSQMPPNLLYMPLGNISGLYGTLPTMLKGYRAVLLDRFTVAGWHDYVLRYHPQMASLPPAGVQMVLDAAIPKEDLAEIRTLSTGAAALDPTVQRAFEDRYGIPILLSYGATEFGGPVSSMTPDLHAGWGSAKFGSVGRAFAGAQLRVIDPDTGAVLPPGQEGILEAIAPRIGPDWIRTADVVVLDEDGFLFHRGRADGAIMRGGFKLLPETIERALVSHPSISAAAVVGVPDRRLGQIPAAAVQLKPGFKQPTIDELDAHLREHVYATHLPAAWLFVNSLPTTPSLKIDRTALRRLFEEGDNT